jgi:hypothetical protein
MDPDPGEQTTYEHGTMLTATILRRLLYEEPDYL